MALLDMGRSYLYIAINTGKLETYCVGRRRFATPEAVDAYVELVRKEAQLEAQAE
jgi:hypothetical protein